MGTAFSLPLVSCTLCAFELNFCNFSFICGFMFFYWFFTTLLFGVLYYRCPWHTDCNLLLSRCAPCCSKSEAKPVRRDLERAMEHSLRTDGIKRHFSPHPAGAGKFRLVYTKERRRKAVQRLVMRAVLRLCAQVSQASATKQNTFAKKIKAVALSAAGRGSYPVVFPLPRTAGTPRRERRQWR